jgi:hypothetical protein
MGIQQHSKSAVPNSISPNLGGVEQFLRLCLQLRRNPAALAAAEAQAPRLDWNAVGQAAAEERVRPLLHQALAGHSIVPAALRTNWRQNYLDNARANLRALHELGKVLRGLHERGIEALVLKGAALVPAMYGNIALRPLRDLDLLVRPEGLEPALECLKELGYQRTGLERQPGSLTDFESQAQLVKPGALGTVVEVHWSLFDSPHYQNRLALEWFWQATEMVEISGTAARVPAHGSHFLYLAGHLWLHHQGAGLLWWNDLAELVTQAPDRFDWNQVMDWAAESELVLPLQRTMAGLAADWAAPGPEGVMDRLRALKPGPAERRVFEAMTAEARPVGERLWVDLLTTPNWRKRLRFAWSNLLPSAKYMRVRYNIRHGLLTPLYYPYRWLLGIRSTLWKV